MKTHYRTHMCAEISREDAGSSVKVCGWVQKSRDMGGVIFIDLRDRSGIIQVVINSENQKEIFELAESVRSEYVLQVSGTVTHRTEDNYNEKLSTGQIEILCSELTVLDTAQTPPFTISDDDNTSELIRMENRFLDLRKESMQKRLMLRHQTAQKVRNILSGSGFVEIETPFLTKPTPEGARDFLVPSRVHKGQFFALPQSPQLFKQILMVSGFDRYFQIVKCFRDEDSRQDRQPEFTQIDMEMSFVDTEDVIAVSEKMIAEIFRETAGFEISLPIKRMRWSEAMERYGSDKPDLRFGLEIADITDIVRNAEFKVFSGAAKTGSVRIINAQGADEKLSRRDLDALTEYVKQFGAKGLAWFVVGETGVTSPVAKFLSEDETDGILKTAQAKPGDIIFAVADKDKIVFEALGALRLRLASQLQTEMKEGYEFLWVTDFPMFEYDETDKRYYAVHHPFTAPADECLPFIETEPERVTAKAYDLVVNGKELGGGSIRIHTKEIQHRVFAALGFSEQEAESKFGFLLNALQYGTPPHGGIAFGFDRLIMTLAQTENIRDVIAFPKTQTQLCPMTQAPAEADEGALAELGIRIAAPKPNA